VISDKTEKAFPMPNHPPLFNRTSSRTKHGRRFSLDPSNSIIKNTLEWSLLLEITEFKAAGRWPWLRLIPVDQADHCALRR